MLTIENLAEDRDLDCAAAQELRGGLSAAEMMPGIMGAMFYSMSQITNHFTQNESNFLFSAGSGSVISIGSLTSTPVTANSGMNLIFS